MAENTLLNNNQNYKSWIGELKAKFRNIQLKAAVAVNTQLLTFYWELGADIAQKQQEATWGDGFLEQLSHDLMAEFPEIKGFSYRNLRSIRQWYLFYNKEDTIWKQPVSKLAPKIVEQITKIPWGHNIAIISKCETVEQALYYVANTIQHNWSRSVLIHQMESGLWQREGKAITNFADTLPAPQSDLARQTLKDPYIFDFLTLTKDYSERELENALIEHVTGFLLELGAGFAYIGRQVQLTVGQQDFYIDLLFYHTRLHCYIVVELKTDEFKPEYAGKLNFYLKAVDEQICRQEDNSTIGILICKNRDKLVVEYALSDINKPIGVSEYQLTQALPENLKSNLPSIEQIEAEFAGDNK